MNKIYNIIYQLPSVSKPCKLETRHLPEVGAKVKELREVGHLILDTFIINLETKEREEWYPSDLTVFDCAPNFGKY